MRGNDQQTAHLFSYLSPDERVPANHPLRAIRQMTDEALAALSERSSCCMPGRAAVSAARETAASVAVADLVSVRSERLLMEQLQYNLLFRWFVGLGMDDQVWTPTTFANRERLLAGDVAQAFFAAVTGQAEEARLLSDEHFTVDGTLLEAAASLKISAKGRPGPPPDDPGDPTVNFHGERQSNATHQSTTEPTAACCGRRMATRPSCGVWAGC